ncbi:osiris 16 [Culex quinquefasciatus]|uniref:Osiris 16 n=2 Tax=Culex quinquefasciatus TaxID=7176 RepID=B0WS73_CULQU|nr:osiris 16 [Culex quinquefasciatus]|eukprot:XP_001851557.1 osiris 16 [Culex quinquefasciatus]
MFVNFVIVVSVILGFVSGAISEKSRKICDNKYSLTCLKLEIVSFLERISDQSEYNLMSGVSVVKDNTVNVTKTAEIIAEVSRIFPADPNKRLDEFLIVKLNDYLKSHSLRLKLMDNEAMEKARDLFEGRKGKLGKKGGLETMIAAAMMMKGTLGAIALGTLALIAGKALMTGLLAMTLATIVGLKSLTSGGGGGHKSTTYEIVAKPVYSHSSHTDQQEDIGVHPSGFSAASWGRSQRLEMPKY